MGIYERLFSGDDERYARMERYQQELKAAKAKEEEERRSLMAIIEANRPPRPHKSLKAIETHYKGYRFRSRLEARWAVFFDDLGLAWEYEKEGFELPSGRYLPDFFIDGKGMQTWLEVKGKEPTNLECERCHELAQAASLPVLLCSGMIEPHMEVIEFQPEGFMTYPLSELFGLSTDSAVFAARHARFEFDERKH